MKKNVKGIVGLVAGLLAIACIVISFIPTKPINHTSAMFFGKMNVLFAAASVVLGIVALVAGIMSRKNKDKKGPRKAGIIIGIISIIIGIIATASTALLSVITLYANNPNDKAFSEFDASQKKAMDEFVDQLIHNQ